MKKLMGVCLALLCSAAVYAAQTKNTMKMVSYFPIPYVAYDNMIVTNSMDIGILDQCSMDVYASNADAMNDNALYFQPLSGRQEQDLFSGLVYVTQGKLDLNSNVLYSYIKSKNILVGQDDGSGYRSLLEFGVPVLGGPNATVAYIGWLPATNNSLRVVGGDQEDYALEVKSFKMYGLDFPSCSGTVRWEALEIGAKEGTNDTYTDLFLVCE